jgi:MoxR-like ATPase
MKRRLTKPDDKIELTPLGSKPEEVHVFDDDSIWAINAALAARRPLLIRGEPGVGKTQIARAAAAKEMLNCPLIPFVVDSNTESRDLLWTFDAVQRLAEAQINRTLDEPNLRKQLSPENYFHPGPLWWAFHWKSAETQATKVGDNIPASPTGWKPGDGCVVLIDEIDKAESDVPNGLLEALGAGCFQPRGMQTTVDTVGEPPLVIITTNEERVLPDAFLRRCLVLDLALPTNADELKLLLIQRGKSHFEGLTNDDVLVAGVDLLITDRFASKSTPRPGQAEYLDLIRAVIELCPKKAYKKQLETLQRVARFVLKKHTAGQ